MALRIPREYHCTQKTVNTGKEALLILLRRLAYPNRWCDLVALFGRSETEMSLIFKEIIGIIYQRFNHILEDLNHLWLDPSVFSAAL